MEFGLSPADGAVGAETDERRLRRETPRRFQHVQSADRVHVEIIRERRDAARSWLGWCGIAHDQVRPHRFEAGQHRSAVADIDFEMAEILVLRDETALIPAGITRGTRKIRPHVVVDAVDAPIVSAKYSTTSEPISPDDPVTSRFFISRVYPLRRASTAAAILNRRLGPDTLRPTSIRTWSRKTALGSGAAGNEIAQRSKKLTGFVLRRSSAFLRPNPSDAGATSGEACGCDDWGRR